MTEPGGPDFIVIGEQKCGTGWIRDRLREHPSVYFRKKEVNFFSHKRIHRKGIDWYRALFSGKGEGITTGEKSPEYFWMESGREDYIQGTLPLIKDQLPGVRVILSLRNPVHRAISALHHHLYHRGRRVSPRQARENLAGEFFFGDLAEQLTPFGVLERGFYSERLGVAQEIFGSDLLVLVFEEDIVGDPESGLKQICEHIGVDFRGGDFWVKDNSKARKPSYFQVWGGFHLPVLRPLLRMVDRGAPFRIGEEPDLRERLMEFYANDIDGTQSRLGRPLNSWKSG